MTAIARYCRRLTNQVRVAGIPMGSDYPIRVQSMTNTLTSDITGSVAQSIRIIEAGADYVRFTVPSIADVRAIASIKQELMLKGYSAPVIADVHFNPEIALQVAEHADKVRINPGNFADREKFKHLLEKCRKHGVALRIGVNHGSLSERILNEFGDTPAGMAESALEFLRVCQENDFDQVVVSMKASNVRVMVYATRLVVKKMHREGMYFPLHLGVTEAGEGEDGRIKSACGIGALLADGLGDTIRVSLTEDPENEIPVARKIIEFMMAARGQDMPPAVPDFSEWQYGFARHVTRKTGNVGGNQLPVVIGSDRLSDRVKLVKAASAELTDAFIRELISDHEAVLVYMPVVDKLQTELRWLRKRLQDQRCMVPVIFKLDLAEKSEEDFMLKSASCLGGAFIEGFGDGIWLTNSYPLAADTINKTALGILQACRARMFKTEYIACPSCGRTHFNLMETLSRIKAATSHLKGLKIGVMGCIVNGPGEMADADYGYVGAGKGRITLYKSREVVKTGIPEENAVDEMIKLIKDHGDWVDP
jgi:(E)-4-hydroxy-3-methylbut-2-enyl-diphosphate synthase